MNRPALELGKAALADPAYFEECCGKIIATRERVKKELSRLGFSFGDSMANFLFVTHERISARELFEALKIKKIFVRYFNCLLYTSAADQAAKLAKMNEQ